MAVECDGSVNLMQLFWDLSCTNEEEKILSAKKMVVKLCELQTTNGGDDEVQYCLGRLVKGLGSNRKSARHGYFIALCEVLKSVSIPLSDVFKLMRQNLEHTGNVKAQEERGAYFGRVFALLAVVQSGQLEEPADIEHVTKGLMKVYHKKSYLQEFCVVTIGQLLNELEERLPHTCKYIIPLLGLECGWDKCTPEILYLLLNLQDKYSNEEWFKDLLSSYWDSSDIVTRHNMKKLADVLMISSHSHPRIHTVWPLLINKIRGGPLWSELWKTVIDDSLMTSSHERKYLCLQLLETFVLPSLALNEVGAVLSPRLLHQVQTNAGATHHLLHNAAQHFLQQLGSVTVSVSDPAVQLAVPMHLLRSKVSKDIFGSTIQQLLENVSVVGVVRYLEYLLSDLWTNESTDSKHEWIIYQINLMIKSVNGSLRHREWFLILAKFLFLHSHFDILKPIPDLNVVLVSEPVTKSDRNRYKEKLFSIMTDLSNLKHKGGRSQDQGETSCDYWSVTMVLYIEDLLTNHSDAVKLVTDIDQEIWDKSLEVLTSLNEKETRSGVDNAFLYLLSVSLLDIFGRSEKKESIIEEILICYEKMTSSQIKTPRPGRRKITKVTPTSPNWLEVLMDILLELLSYPNQFWRNVVERVFHLLMKSLTHDTIQLIIKTLQPQSVSEVMEKEEEEMEEDKEEEEEEDEEEMEEEEDEEEMKSDFIDVGAEFRANVRNALGELAAADSDQESIESLDEDQMECLDQALAAVFQKQKEKSVIKKQKKFDQTTMMHFKMRVLDLVDQFIRFQSSNPLMLEFLVPLFKVCISYRSHKILSPLSERCTHVLEKLCRVKTYPREGVDTEMLHSILDDFINRKLYKTKKLSPLLTQSIMFLIRVLKGVNVPPAISPILTRSSRKRKQDSREEKLEKIGSLKVEEVIKWCTDALHHMITEKNSNVPIGFFVTFCERQAELSWTFLATLTAVLPCTGNHFKKIQAYTILNEILSKNTMLSEENVVTHLTLVVEDLQNIIVQDLMCITTADKLTHHKIIVQCLDKLVMIIQSHDQLKVKLNVETLSEVMDHLSSFDDHKLYNIINRIQTSFRKGFQVPPKVMKRRTT